MAVVAEHVGEGPPHRLPLVLHPQHTKVEAKMKVMGRQTREDCLAKNAEGDTPIDVVETTNVKAGKAALIPSSSSDRRKETAPNEKATSQAAGTAAASEVAASCADGGSFHSAAEIRKKKRALLESSGSSRGHRGGPGAALSLVSLAAAEEQHKDVGGDGVHCDDDIERSEIGVQDPDPDAPTQKRTRRATEIVTGNCGTVSVTEASVAWAMATAAAEEAEVEASDAALVAAMTAAKATRAAAELLAAEAAVALLKERAAKAKAAAARGSANAAKATAQAAAQAAAQTAVADTEKGSSAQVEDIQANVDAKRAPRVSNTNDANGNGRAGQATAAAASAGVVQQTIAVGADSDVIEEDDGTMNVLSGSDLPVDRKRSKVPGSLKKKKSVKTYRGKIKTDIPCRIKGCSETCNSAYSARSRVCLTHIRAPAVEIDSVMSRFCQKCTRFHSVDAFRPTNRTCSKQLDKTSKNSGEMTKVSAGGAVVNDVPPGSDLVGEMAAKMTAERFLALHSHASAAAGIPAFGFVGGMPWGAATMVARQAALHPTTFDSYLLSSLPVPLASAIAGRGGGGGIGGGDGWGTSPKIPVSFPRLEQEPSPRRVAESENHGNAS